MKIRGVQLQKQYKGRKVVLGVNYEISQGEIVGLLGPNGAGKTTTFYMTVGWAPALAARLSWGMVTNVASNSPLITRFQRSSDVP